MKRSSSRCSMVRAACLALAFGLGAALLGEASCFAGEEKGAEKSSAAAGKLVTADGTVFRRDKPEADWQVVKQGAGIPGGNLLVGLPGAAIDSLDGAVRLSFHGDLDESSPLPIAESAVMLNPAAGADFDVLLDRGRVDLSNHKDKGSAHIMLRYRTAVIDMTLAEPGTRVALEAFSRWAPGTRFLKEPKKGQEPTATFIILVLKGKATIKGPKQTLEMSEPPGKALFQWDSVNGGDDGPQPLAKLPPWATEEVKNSPLVKEKLAQMERFRQAALKKPVPEVLAEMLHSDDANARRLAVIACGAFDQLTLLGDALVAGKYPDLWSQAVVTMRHWIGRGAGQDVIFYNRLLEIRKMTPGEASIVLSLLHSFDETDTAQPELYETLIDYLKDKRLAIRGLAHWHLYRLVPAGRSIPYNPNGTPAELEQAYTAWKKLVPSGQMPPRVSSKEKPK